ncbi:Cytosolic phospholipase A2, partial [Stylophora pistillata]
DTPDPYVKLYIQNAPNGRTKTQFISNDPNPVWNEEFKFLIDKELENVLHITLMDADTFSDDVVGKTQIFPLDGLEIDRICRKTFVFRKKSEVDITLELRKCEDPRDLRYSVELCQEEIDFRENRKPFLFQAMKKLLGPRGPARMDELPTVGIVGSGGGFRAMVGLSGVFCALKDMGVLDCAMYAAGLSGSTWYLSALYSHPKFPYIHPKIVMQQLRHNVQYSWIRLLTPSWLYKHIKIIHEKKVRGQPISFTDFFGYLVGETILRDRKTIPKLSDQRVAVRYGNVPLPLYTCVQVKNDVSAKSYNEWVEFSPYEVGMAKYGTFMKAEHFGSKFFCGQLHTQYPEPPLEYLQGIWGSAFTVLLQRLLSEGQVPSAIEKVRPSSSVMREDLHQILYSENQDDDEESDSEEEEQSVDGHHIKEAPVFDDNDMEEPKEEDHNDPGLLGRIAQRFMNKFPVLQTRSGRAGRVHNFLRGLGLAFAPVPLESEDVTDAADQLSVKSKRIFLADSGLVFNSPYPLLIRPQRGCDVLLSFDFSSREREIEMPFEELLLAEEWARKNRLKFPPINAKEQYEEHGLKEFYVFSDPNDPECPVVIHFVLMNGSFKDYSRPGVPRKTSSEKEFGTFAVFEDPDDHYSTFNFHYSHNSFDRLSQLMEFNTLLAEETIKDVIADGVRRKRQLNAMKSST